MAKKRSPKKRSTKKQMSVLERRLLTLEREHHELNRRIKKLTKRVEALPDPRKIFGKGGFAKNFTPPWARGPGGPRGGPRGGPWRKEFTPVVSLEVPLETDDPAAPLWATVSARLPEEITTVGDEGAIVRYRYSAAGSTPQAPRYRQIQEPPEPFPA